MHLFEFESIEFTQQSVMNKEKKRLVKELCDYAGVDRDSFRLQRGNVTLYGLTLEGNWMPLTSHVGDFVDKLKQKNYFSFKLKTKLQIIKKK